MMLAQSQHTEHETKFAITDVAAMIERLRQAGRFMAMTYIRDIFYRDQTGRRLRYRLEESADKQHLEVIEKRYVTAADGIKVETEEMHYSGEDANVAAAMILGQGHFRRQNAVEKIRMIFSVSAVQAMLDIYPFGVWLELEGKPDDIWSVAGILGFTKSDATVKNADELYLQWQRRHHEPEFWDIRFGLEKTEAEDTIKKD